jgi:hypothetical protein
MDELSQEQGDDQVAEEARAEEGRRTLRNLQRPSVLRAKPVTESPARHFTSPLRTQVVREVRDVSATFSVEQKYDEEEDMQPPPAQDWVRDYFNPPQLQVTVQRTRPARVASTPARAPAATMPARAPAATMPARAPAATVPARAPAATMPARETAVAYMSSVRTQSETSDVVPDVAPVQDRIRDYYHPPQLRNVEATVSKPSSLYRNRAWREFNA